MSSHYGHEGPMATPGWYPDGRGQTRYWTGASWTNDVAPATPAPPSPSMHITLYPPPTHQAPPPRPVRQVSPKSPGLAVLGSFFVPGLGQLINGQGSKALFFFFCWVASFVLIFILIGFLTAPIVWVWSMADAHSSARHWNLRHGIIS